MLRVGPVTQISHSQSSPPWTSLLPFSHLSDLLSLSYLSPRSKEIMATTKPAAEDYENIRDPLLDHHPVNLRRYASNSTSQVAIIGSNLCPIESLDYEIMENNFFKQDWRSGGRTHIIHYVILKWSLCLLVGVLAGAVGFLNNLAIENLSGLKLLRTSDLMFANRYLMAFGVFAIPNFVLTMLAVTITSYIAPAAAGSGIPEVKAYLNGVDAPDILSPRTLLVKIVGCIAAVSSSLHVGKAGPMVHIGACISALFGHRRLHKYHFTGKWLKYLNNDRDRRDLVTCGAAAGVAAGVAAAFRSPLGGVLFALESLSSWWRSSLLWRAFFTTAVVAIVLRALIDVCNSGKCGLFGKGGLIMFDVTSTTIAYHLVDLPLVILLGVIGGILGSFYNFLMEKVLRIYTYINEKGTGYRLLLAGTISIFTSCLLFGLPWFASCQPCPDAEKERCPTIGKTGKFKNFQCPPNYYNDLASLFFNTNDDTIRNLYSSGSHELFDQFSIILSFVTSYFLGIISYGIVAPAGLFVPVILTGAVYGRCVGMLMGSQSTLDHGLYAVLGSASFLGGTLRMTVSVCVIILELTNNLLLLPLIMLVLLISKSVADYFNGNIYDLILKLKGLPYLRGHAEPYMRQLTVSDVVMGPLRIFNGVEKVGNIVHVLKTTGHHGFPVIDEPPFSSTPVLSGLVLRSYLLVLLKKRDFLPNCRLTSVDFSNEYSFDDFSNSSGSWDSIEDIELTADELEMYIDLHPFTNTSPYTVVQTMSLAKALVLFRELGLRHLLVVPKTSCRCPVAGILTRHDFMPEYIYGLHPLLMKIRWKKLRFEGSILLKYFKGILLGSAYTTGDSISSEF